MNVYQNRHKKKLKIYKTKEKKNEIWKFLEKV